MSENLTAVVPPCFNKYRHSRLLSPNCTPSHSIAPHTRLRYTGTTNTGIWMTGDRKGPRSRNEAARLSFFARREEITRAMRDGAFLREICERTEFPGSYTQFTRLVRRHIGGRPLPSRAGQHLGRGRSAVEHQQDATVTAHASRGRECDTSKRLSPTRSSRADLFDDGY